MNTSIRNHHWGVSRATALVCLLLAGVWTGCKPEETTSSSPTSPSSSNATEPVYTSAVPTSFDAVTAQLDAGGNLYAFLGTRQWMEGISDKVNEWRDALTGLPDQSPEDAQMVSNVFNLATTLIIRSGIEEVAGAGISGIAIEPDLFRTKLFVHRNGAAEPGGLWTLFGSEPHAFAELDFLPADTVWAAASELQLAELWGGLESIVSESDIPELQKGMGQAAGVAQAVTGKPLDELLSSLDGSMGAFITLDANKQVTFPVDENSIELPEPGIVFMFRVKDDTLFDLLSAPIMANPDAVVRDEGELRMRTMPVPVPIPLEVRPTVARHGDYLFLASHDRLIDDLLAVERGEAPGLKSTPEFVRISKGVPETGNSFVFLSARLAETIQSLQRQVIASEMANEENAGLEDLMNKLYSSGGAASVYSVGRSMPDGWLTVSHGTQEPSTALLAPLVIAPAAVVAGLTLPAVAKAKEKAEQISCVNNIKQLCLGALIYAADNEDRFPDNIRQLEEALGVVDVLFCPSAPNIDEWDSPSWNELDEETISYIYSGSGLTTAESLDTVIWRCRYHDNTGHADGSVLQN